MGRLHDRMAEDLRLRNFSPTTQRNYLFYARRFAAFFMRWDDMLIGGSADDLILGGLGNDFLVGGAGDDLLIGGAGNDRLVGAAGNDLLVSGDVAATLTRDDLDRALIGWATDKSYNAAIDVLARSLAADDSLDVLTGGSGADLFYIGLGDMVTGFKAKNTNGAQVVVDSPHGRGHLGRELVRTIA